MKYETAVSYVEEYVRDLDREAFEAGNPPLTCLDLRVWRQVLWALKDGSDEHYKEGYDQGFSDARTEYEHAEV